MRAASRFRFTLAVALLSSAVAPVLPAQSRTAQDSVVAVVNEFFRAMQASDSAAAARTVDLNGQIFAFQPRGDSAVLMRSSLGTFPGSLVGNKRALLERMWDPTVMVHGPMAVVWTAYDFHTDGAFSHCGIDAFTLARTSGTWKIVNVTYTVERTGCKPSPLGPVKK
ncbi:MAG: nuclear transport factor 2 family protein [Gemmatimonas sp.]